MRQTRYKEALSFLAHSLKTPLAVLRGALGEPDRLHAAVVEQAGAGVPPAFAFAVSM